MHVFLNRGPLVYLSNITEVYFSPFRLIATSEDSPFQAETIFTAT